MAPNDNVLPVDDAIFVVISLAMSVKGLWKVAGALGLVDEGLGGSEKEAEGEGTVRRGSGRGS